ncbi:bifunctional SulP family inorganic anion transporter/carbonic anhydrase [Tundrisphaera lichenicola]|uniref:bifunctional SulP family inorganic anion transporter/carbonic anhydrase n=1 Tax=Tundrisphaera lichenicola TaxID=2029860 RepID=UPI003EBB9408
MNLMKSSGLRQDLAAGLVVFLVALPLCLGVALASNAPLFAGVLGGIVGGILVGILSGSHTSVSGPGNTLMAIVAVQIVTLGSFRAFLLALVVAGMIQVVLGIVRAGSISAFVPSSVIKGMLAAIGLILILKQVPHILGHDPDPEGEMSFFQPDRQNTFSELIQTIGDLHPGAATIGLLSIALLILWDRWTPLKRLGLPAPLVVVMLGVGMNLAFRRIGAPWQIGPGHLVQVPVAESLAGFLDLLQMPDFSQWSNPAVYTAALTIAAVASLESLLSLEAADKLDPKRRSSPPNREMVAQGIGNIAAGMIGGIPITSVVVRSSVNINAGGRTKRSTIVHGLLLLVSVVELPSWLNMIPLSCLAAILLVTGVKLASPALVRQMWHEGRYQFIPFAMTVASILLTDLLIGLLIGMTVSIGFILRSNVRRPLRRVVEKHLGGEVTRIELANQVSFLNRAALDLALDGIPSGGHVLLDARNTDYIDPDLLSLIRDFEHQRGPARGVQVSLIGFRQKYQLRDQTRYADYSTREIQKSITPEQVLDLLKEGNERFRAGHRLTRDHGRLVSNTALGQHPLAVVLGCIDSRTPAELIFDASMGDLFSVRIAGNVVSRKVLGSIEYSCAAAGAKLVLVMGHTRCGAVTAAVQLATSHESIERATGCQHLAPILEEIQRSIDPETLRVFDQLTQEEKEPIVNAVAWRNVEHIVEQILRQSRTLNDLVVQGRIAIVGAMYDVATGEIAFLPDRAVGLGPGLGVVDSEETVFG